MHSGSSATLPLFNADRTQDDWDNFVRSVPECASLSTTNDTFGCLQTATAATILHASIVARRTSTNTYPFYPTLDGPEGLLPDQPSKLLNGGRYARLPFITGDCLDEGNYYISIRPLLLTNPICILGPMFVQQSTNTTEDIRQWLTKLSSPWPAGPESLARVVDRILELYPDDPAAGSPFNTGNETFGLNSKFKQSAAICTCHSLC
jgi:acetylcholinesterase